MSIISVEALTKSYFHKNVLTDISLRLNEGDRLGLIGANGAGKTTLFRIITGTETPDSGRVVIAKGRILGYLGQHTDNIIGGGNTTLKNKELHELEAAILEAQHNMAAIPDHMSSEYKVAEETYTKLSARFEAMDGYAYERRVKEILTGLELSEAAFDTETQLLSGGEKMRVALAHLLLKQPDVLLLDEPTNHLDITAMEWLEDVLVKFSGALIIISHDRYFLDRVCNKTAELEDGSIVIQSGNYSTFMKQKTVEMDFANKERIRLEREIERQAQIKQTMLSHRKMASYHMKEKQIAKLSGELAEVRSSARHSTEGKLKFNLLPMERVRNPKSVIVKVEGLSKSFGTNLLFHDINFDVTAVDKLFFVGPNGCGKSTLLSILLGLQDEYEGKVSVSKYSTYAYMGQKVSFTDENMTLYNEMMSRFEFSESQTRSLLASFGFYGTDTDKRIASLSGGERSRLYLACLIQENPEIIFLDEPTNHLDIPSREILEKALDEFGGALIAVSHDRYFIEKCARKIFGFIDKGLQEFNSYDEYRLREREAVKAADVTKKAITDQTALDNPASLRRNKAAQRKEAALKRDMVRSIEQQISECEASKAEMEASFNALTTPEEYVTYSQLLARIDELYAEYEKSMEF